MSGHPLVSDSEGASTIVDDKLRNSATATPMPVRLSSYLSLVTSSPGLSLSDMVRE
jgi:hypothetical protein